MHRAAVFAAIHSAHPRPPLPGFDAEWLAAVLLALRSPLPVLPAAEGATAVAILLSFSAWWRSVQRTGCLGVWTTLCIYEPRDRAIALLASYCVGRWLVMRDLKRTGIAAVCVGLVVGGFIRS